MHINGGDFPQTVLKYRTYVSNPFTDFWIWILLRGSERERKRERGRERGRERDTKVICYIIFVHLLYISFKRIYFH